MTYSVVAFASVLVRTYGLISNCLNDDGTGEDIRISRNH